MDNGNFCRHAARGLRDYCGVDATAYAANPDTYVNIPDPTVERWNPHTGDYPDADFYLLNDHTYFYHYRYFKDHPRLVKCNGTFARDQGGWFQWDYVKHNTHYLSSPCDYTLARALPFTIQSIPPLIDARLFPSPNRPTDTIRVGHAPTNPYKGTKTILAALHPYRQAGTITIDLIQHAPWTECMDRKAQCHLFIDQAPPDAPHPGVARGAFGINAIESLALGSIVLNEPLHPYVEQHIPYIQAYISRFPEQLAFLIKGAHRYVAEEHTQRSKYAQQHFDLSTQAPKLHDWIRVILNDDS
jgi:hypothetical protein